uniref:Uncharacterized protein n=1 Tax=Oryza glumipatula TaxID=40148 RepID=A0A0E0BUE9_9ORYZ
MMAVRARPQPAGSPPASALARLLSARCRPEEEKREERKEKREDKGEEKDKRCATDMCASYIIFIFFLTRMPRQRNHSYILPWDFF